MSSRYLAIFSRSSCLNRLLATSFISVNLHSDIWLSSMTATEFVPGQQSYLFLVVSFLVSNIQKSSLFPVSNTPYFCLSLPDNYARNQYQIRPEIAIIDILTSPENHALFIRKICPQILYYNLHSLGNDCMI